MKFINICLAALYLATTFPANAAPAAAQPKVRNLSVERSENKLLVNFTLDLSDVKVKSDNEITLRPIISQGDSTLRLPEVTVAGRNRYIRDRRRHRPRGEARLVRPGADFDYQAVAPYSHWMEQAALSITEDRCGCALALLESSDSYVARLDLREKVFTPTQAYVSPSVTARKARAAKGSAFIDFKVNRTEIDPAYRRNPLELRSIRDTIDLIRNDPDSRIERISITGYASPEGPFANNARLAEGRTEALAAYVKSLYAFPDSLMHTAWVAEDWAGLTGWVENSDIENRDAILRLIADTDLAPDAIERRLKERFPAQFSFLLENVFPGLRHSDYTVEYVISSFSDPAEIARVLREDPRKLSLHEMYVLARTLPADSDEFREVFEVAVRLYPDDPVANLNAAFTALSFGDLAKASQYLAKAGHSPEAVYARGILAAKEGRYADAERLFGRAGEAGLSVEAEDALRQLRELGLLPSETDSAGSKAGIDNNDNN